MKDFYIKYKDIQLHARLMMPSGTNGKVPLVLVIHGLTGCMDEEQLLAVCRAAGNNKMAALSVDMYGHGLSGGDFFNHTVSEWVREIKYIVDFLSESGRYSDIYLCGHSQGGLAALLTAPDITDKIKSLILLSPAVCIVTNSRNGLFFDESFDKNNIPSKLSFWEDFTLSGGYLEDAMTLEYEEAVAGYKGKVLIVHGTADDSVPFSDSVVLADMYADAKLVPVEGDLHCFDYHADLLQKAVEDFLGQDLL